MSHAKRQPIPRIDAAGVLQPPVKVRDAISEAFEAARADVAHLEALRDERADLVSTWSPAQAYRSASLEPAVIDRSTIDSIDAAVLDTQAAYQRERQRRNRARGVCLNENDQGTHGPATHGRKCKRCYAVHKFGQPLVDQLGVDALVDTCRVVGPCVAKQCA